MPDVFLSYANEDRETARAVARLLESAGWTVWWDRRIPVGRTWRSMIEEALRDMRCMVVLWSTHSVESVWVQEEAEEARALGKLIPVLIEPVRPPVGFRSIQALDLTNWDGSKESLGAQQLIADLESLSRMPSSERRELRIPSSGGREEFSEASEERYMKEIPTRQSSKGAVNSVMTGAIAVVTTTIAVVAGAVITAIDFMRPSRYQTKRPSEHPELEPRADFLSAPVYLGVAAPREAEPGSSFNARFVAYVSAAKESAQGLLKDLGAKDDRVVTGIPPDRQPCWRIGAPITVRATGEHMRIEGAEREFEWNGRENLVSFAVSIDTDAPRTTLLLCFHVFLGPLPVAFIPFGIAVGVRLTENVAREVERRAPSSAFASYSSKDAEPVARSLSTLAHWAPTLDIFLDCLDLAPNEAFKPKLAVQIAARDVFLLFWSRNARASQWVLWEYETARVRPGIDAILPIPLEDPAIAPPPPGFEDKHLRDRFMIAGYGLKKIAEVASRTSTRTD